MILFDSKNSLEERLLEELLNTVKNAISKFGDARILLSGGNSPKSLYLKFANSNLDWSKVHIGLVDDRVVPLSHEKSNEKMIRDIFADLKIDMVHIYGLVPRDGNIDTVEAKYNLFFERIDFTLLGMGTDGHTASLFPGDKISEQLLNSDSKEINYTTSPVFPKERITCSKGLLKKSLEIVLMIFGEEKRSVLERSKAEKMPISYFVEECPQLKTYYSTTS